MAWDVFMTDRLDADDVLTALEAVHETEIDRAPDGRLSVRIRHEPSTGASDRREAARGDVSRRRESRD